MSVSASAYVSLSFFLPVSRCAAATPSSSILRKIGALDTSPDCFGFLSVNVDTEFRMQRSDVYMKDLELHRNIRDLAISLHTLAVHHPGAKTVILTDEITYQHLALHGATTTTSPEEHQAARCTPSIGREMSTCKSNFPRPVLDVHYFVELERFNNLTQLYPPLSRNKTTNVDSFYGVHRGEIKNWKLRKSFRRWLVHRDVTRMRGDLNDRAMTTKIYFDDGAASTSESDKKKSLLRKINQDGTQRATTLWRNGQMQFRVVENLLSFSGTGAAGSGAEGTGSTAGDAAATSFIASGESRVPKGTIVEFGVDEAAAGFPRRVAISPQKAGRGLPFAHSPLWPMLHRDEVPEKEDLDVGRWDWEEVENQNHDGEEDDVQLGPNRQFEYLCRDLLHPDADVIFLAKQELPLTAVLGRELEDAKFRRAGGSAEEESSSSGIGATRYGIIKQQQNSMHAALVYSNDKYFGQAFSRDYLKNALAKHPRHMIKYQLGVWGKEFSGVLWEYLPLNRLTRAYFELDFGFRFTRPALWDLNLFAAQYGLDLRGRSTHFPGHAWGSGSLVGTLIKRRHEAMVTDDWINRLGHRETLKILHTRFAHRCCFRTNMLVLNVLRRAHKFNELAVVFGLSLAPYFEEKVWSSVRRRLVGTIGKEPKQAPENTQQVLGTSAERSTAASKSSEEPPHNHLFDGDPIFNKVIDVARSYNFRVPYRRVEQKVDAFSNVNAYKSDRLLDRTGVLDHTFCAKRREMETGAEFLERKYLSRQVEGEELQHQQAGEEVDLEFFNHEQTWRYVLYLYSSRFEMPGKGHYAKQQFNVTADTGYISHGRSEAERCEVPRIELQAMEAAKQISIGHRKP
eukprot:g6710.t1